MFFDIEAHHALLVGGAHRLNLLLQCAERRVGGAQLRPKVISAHPSPRTVHTRCVLILLAILLLTILLLALLLLTVLLLAILLLTLLLLAVLLLTILLLVASVGAIALLRTCILTVGACCLTLRCGTV